MKKIIILQTIFILFFLACDDESNDIIEITKLTIKNESSYELLDVLWNNISFVNEQNDSIIRPGTSITMPVQAGSGFIRFKPKFNPVNIRTGELVIVEQNEQKVFLFINNTIVVNEGNSENSTLTSLANAEGIYQIGDIGPAGGIIFHDKGMFSNNWQYLEAAPLETEVSAQWGASGYDVEGTSLVVGAGKRNTELILERLNELGETGRAAQICTNLNFDGFNDWFLPSREELDLMYKNLKVKNMGGFSSSIYWSSSQYNINYSWIQIFTYGPRYENNKRTMNSVRAIRAF